LPVGRVQLFGKRCKRIRAKSFPVTEGDSHVEWFEGNFEDYEEDKKRRLGEDSIIPKRIKYKKFARA